MEQAKNNKSRFDDDWSHKALCFYHDIYPLAKPFFPEHVIAENKFATCQCGVFKKFVEGACGSYQYRCGLNEVIRNGQGSQKRAHYTDLKIKINDEVYIIPLLTMQAGEIKKITQPTTRKHKLGTGKFYKGAFYMKLGEKHFLEWRLKTRCTEKLVELSKDQIRSDIAHFWYQNWSVHGLMEDIRDDRRVKRFVAIHNNKFVSGTSREACEKRIVIYAYALDGEPFDLTINGIRPRSKAQCDAIKAKLHKNKRRRAEPKALELLMKSEQASVSIPQDPMPIQEVQMYMNELDRRQIIIDNQKREIQNLKMQLHRQHTFYECTRGAIARQLPPPIQPYPPRPAPPTLLQFANPLPITKPSNLLNYNSMPQFPLNIGEPPLKKSKKN